MINNLRYPLLLKPGEFRKLNDQLIGILGTPVFFAAPDLGRPKATGASGTLYEIITGLYIIYHDHGMKLFEKYREFCAMHHYDGIDDVKNHIDAILSLRGGLCHGNLPNGKPTKDLCSTLKLFFPDEDPLIWPDFPSSMTEDQCRFLAAKLTEASDMLASYLICWANNIKSDPSLLQEWRNQLIEKVFNKNSAQYNGRYFDWRIVRYFDDNFNPPADKNAFKEAVKDWLGTLTPKIIGGSFTTSDELSTGLFSAIENLHHPSTASGIATTSSASTIGSDLTL